MIRSHNESSADLASCKVSKGSRMAGSSDDVEALDGDEGSGEVGTFAGESRII